MEARSEVERTGLGLTAAGVAQGGTYLALVSSGSFGMSTTAPVIVAASFLVFVPAALVAAVLWALGASLSIRLHPFVTAFGTIVGGLLSFPLFEVFGLTGLLGMPTLLAYATFMLAQFLLDRPTLSGVGFGVDSAGTLVLHSLVASYPLGILLGWVDPSGCEGCGRTESLITAAFVLTLALLVIATAATRYRRGSNGALPRPLDSGRSP